MRKIYLAKTFRTHHCNSRNLVTTYVGYITSFNMKIDNLMQEFILFMNPLSFLLFVYGIALFMKSTKRRNIYLMTISIIDFNCYV